MKNLLTEAGFSMGLITGTNICLEPNNMTIHFEKTCILRFFF
ncbi:MAG: hypothetical protein JWQ38_2449 [Flavipsychrobacter sp.]|nr:hypothetical protein [Flavipsychrobacter sp.]